MSDDVQVDDAQGGSEATYATYTIGFVLAIILTVIPFGFVAFAGLSKVPTLSIVAVAAVIQILVHLYFFLHLDASKEHRANTMTGLFTVLILGVLVGGTIWLFFSLMERTMPTMPPETQNTAQVESTSDMNNMSAMDSMASGKNDKSTQEGMKDVSGNNDMSSMKMN
jgi:cytochrome o ubiquinol oxidase operon protein cyoD